MSVEITLTSLALVERIVLEDIAGVYELSSMIPADEVGKVASCLATLLAASLTQAYGDTKAIEAISRWRSLALEAEQ